MLECHTCEVAHKQIHGWIFLGFPRTPYSMGRGKGIPLGRGRACGLAWYAAGRVFRECVVTTHS